ncbi:MAG: hypothetical protein PV362_11165 [Providencia heimbachae]|nr:hypothetical protein [Providencia heimbachae]
METPEGRRKPNLITARSGKALIIDAQVVGSNVDLETAHRRKIEYYSKLENMIKTKCNTEAEIFSTITLNKRGVWNRKSAEHLVTEAIINNNELKVISSRAIIGGITGFGLLLENYHRNQELQTRHQVNHGSQIFQVSRAACAGENQA